MKNRFATAALALALLEPVSCSSSSSTSFCSQTVTITFPAPTDGGCPLAQLALDGGLALTEVVPSNTAACTEAMKSCSTADQVILNDRVTCANDAGMNAPACTDNEIERWISTMDQALGSCITTNLVSASCQGALNDAGS